ncbi:DUF551 domain-containing protein, partial [Pantoea ananatis]|uniref:DUF551 domain-containing protein n=1 Tax=Pantoea ananas TaxID=553 RepID=UPI001B308D91
ASISADPLVDSNKPLYAAPQPAPGYATAMKVNLSEADSEKLIAELQKVNIEPSSLSLPVPSDWISCSERLPEKECDVLAIWNGSMEVLHLDDMVGLWDDGDFNSRIPLEDVTHWMPLPQGPF